MEEIEYEEYAEPLTEMDTEPPIITLLGFPYVEVMQRQAYADVGAQAVDAVDGYTAVTVDGLQEINTSQTTANDYVITYSAVDSSNNSATPVQRRVAVVNPCPSPAKLCDLPLVRSRSK